MAAVDRPADDVKALSELGQELLRVSRFQQAAVVGRSVTDLAPDNPAGWFLQGSAALGLGDADGAELCFAQALQLDGRSLRYCEQMANVCFQRGDMAEAGKWF